MAVITMARGQGDGLLLVALFIYSLVSPGVDATVPVDAAGIKDIYPRMIYPGKHIRQVLSQGCMAQCFY